MSKWSHVSCALIAGLALGCSLGVAPADERVSPPSLNGWLLFHRYTGYDNYDSQLFLFDYQANSLTCISESWPIDHAMNAHFSPDGERIVFMGLLKGKRNGCSYKMMFTPIGLCIRNAKRVSRMHSNGQESALGSGSTEPRTRLSLSNGNPIYRIAV